MKIIFNRQSLSPISIANLCRLLRRIDNISRQVSANRCTARLLAAVASALLQYLQRDSNGT
jgi:hypothetical protein